MTGINAACHCEERKARRGNLCQTEERPVRLIVISSEVEKSPTLKIFPSFGGVPPAAAGRLTRKLRMTKDK
jgi:hypothetical protein